MEITKNLIVYKHKKHSRLTNFNLGNNYKDKFGKIHYLKDVNGLSINFVTSQSSFILNKTIENDVLTDEWLQNHPDVINGWERTDVQEKEQIDTKNTLDSAQAIIEAAKMNIKDVMDFAKLHKMNMNSNTDVLRAHIIKVAQVSPEKFISIVLVGAAT